MSISVDPDWWKELFDETYLVTDARSVCNDRITRREVDVICDLLPIKKGHRLLDLCGGHGRHVLELYNRGFKLCTLLDYSETLINRAKEDAARQGCGLGCLRADARQVGLASDCFDHIFIMGNSLGYILDQGADHEILAEAYRLLVPGGWLLVDVSNREALRTSVSPVYWHEIEDDIVVCRQREVIDDTIRAREMVISKTNGLVRDKTYAIRLYNAQALARLLENVGFTAVHVHTRFDPHGKKGDYGCMNNRMLGIGRK